MGGPSSGMAHSSAAQRRLSGAVAQAVFSGEVFGRHSSPSVMEIWAMRDDGPPIKRPAFRKSGRVSVLAWPIF